MKNRFFIERDSKTRRIMNNFGLTFRNSHWTPFAQTNLSIKKNLTSSKTQFFLFLAATLFLLVGVIPEFIESVFEYSQNNALHSTASLAGLVSYIKYTFYRQWVSGVFCISTDSKELAVEPNPINSSLEPGLFSQITSNRTQPQFTRSLYSLQNEIQKLDQKARIGKVKFVNTQITTFQPHQEVLKVSGTLFPSRTQQGSFVFENHTFNQISALELLSTHSIKPTRLASLHTRYLTSANMDRWFYRYSNLHRRSVQAASTLTHTKRLMSQGFFSESLGSNNLWASNFLATTPNLNTVLTGLYDKTYGGVWNEDTNSLKDVEFFESSYFWTLKRFYNLNALDRNHDISTWNVVSAEDASLTKQSNLNASTVRQQLLTSQVEPTSNHFLLKQQNNLYNHVLANTSEHSTGTKTYHLTTSDVKHLMFNDADNLNKIYTNQLDSESNYRLNNMFSCHTKQTFRLRK